MKKVLFEGSGVAIVTPFTNEGINYKKLEELLEWHLQQKTDAIIVCGTTGEASTMPDDEHKEAIRFTVEKVRGRIPVIAGAGSNYTKHAIELSEYAESVGADGLLHVTPYYNKTTPHGLYNHFKEIAKSVNIPIILYNVPSRTGMGITIDTLIKLSEIDNIVGIKEASGNISYLTEVAAKCPELAIYSGNDDMIIPAMSVGALGVISVAANIIPTDVHKMCRLYLDGQTKEAASYQLKMMDLINALFIEVNPVPIKTAMNLLGFDVGELRAPLYTMEEKNLSILKNALENYQLKVKI